MLLIVSINWPRRSDDPAVYGVTAVHEHVAQADDSGKLRNRNRSTDVDRTKLSPGLAGDFELALNGGSEQLVGLVLSKL